MLVATTTMETLEEEEQKTRAKIPSSSQMAKYKNI
jgi:hypothetical protein